MDVYWIRGHSDEKMDKSEITVHHERQQQVDKLTKKRSEHEAICTLQTPGRLRVLYTEDAKDNNEAKHEITEPLRRHIAKTAQSRRSMNHLTEAEKRHYGPDNAKRGEGFIHCQMCPDQILGNNFQPKMVHRLLPDGARMSLMRGGKKELSAFAGSQSRVRSTSSLRASTTYSGRYGRTGEERPSSRKNCGRRTTRE